MDEINGITLHQNHNATYMSEHKAALQTEREG